MKTFKQIYIKSKDDLPKDGEEWYYGHTTDTNEIVRLKDTRHSDWTCIDWYLIEAPDNRDEIIAKMRELIEFYELLFDGDTLQHIHEAKLRLELSALEANGKSGQLKVT